METTASRYDLTCPYCGAPCPTEADPKQKGQVPNGIEVMPYTRSKGEFEGKHEWSRIGRDFIGSGVNWESVGILRVADRDTSLNVTYQLVECCACHHYFDVYLNWTPAQTPADFWPHLFARDSQGEIRRYTSKSWTYDRLLTLGRRLGSLDFAAALVLVALLVVSFIPRVLIALFHEPDNPAQYFLDTSAIPLMSRAIGIVVLGFLVTHLARFVSFLQETGDFHKLFDVRQPSHTTHWLNYTSARLVGVQPPGRHALTQTSVLAGFPSAILLLAVWLLQHLGKTSEVPAWLNLLLLPALALTGYLLWSWRDLRRRSEPVTFMSLLTPVYRVRMAGAVWGLAAWFVLAVVQMVVFDLSNWYWVIDGLFEAVFWAIVAFYVGISMQVGFGLAIYVLFQVGRMPLLLHPLRGFDELAPVWRLVIVGMGLLMGVLLMILLLGMLPFVPWEGIGLSLPAERIIENTTWLFDWATVGVLLLIAMLGIVVSRFLPLAVAAYLVVLLIIPGVVDSVPDCTGTSVDEVCQEVRLDVPVIQLPVGGTSIPFLPTLVWLGAFLSGVVLVYVQRVYTLYRGLQERAREKLLSFYNERIVELSNGILQGADAADESSRLQNLLQVRDYIKEIEGHGGVVRLVLDALSPFVVSVALPTILQLAADSLGVPLSF